MTETQMRALLFAIFKAADAIATQVALIRDDTADYASSAYLMDAADDALERARRRM